MAQRIFFGFLGLFLISLLGPITAAQSSKVSATLEGTVTDSSQGVIPNTAVRLRNLDTNQVRTTVTDERGFFRVGGLEVGTYEVEVAQPGFAHFRHSGLIVSVGQMVRLDVTLVPATATAEVTVVAQPPAIETSQPALTSTIDNERIEELPVSTRNYLNFVLLAPGVGAAPQQQQGSGAPLAASGFTFGGLRPRSNNISIDGLDNNDEYTGASRTELSLEIVREFQVVNNGLSAESGGASGGAINVVTKSGTNVVHGDAFLFAQNGALDARDPVTTETEKPHFSHYRGGVSLGGPLVKDRTFYYAAFEQEQTRGEGSTDIAPQVASSVNEFLSGGRFPRVGTNQITTGFFPTARAETEASGKLQHAITKRNSLMLRYAFTNNREAGDAFNSSGLNDAGNWGSSFTEDHALVGSLLTVAGPAALNNLRFQLATRRVVLRSNDPVGPEIDVSGLIRFGASYAGNSRRRENHYQLTDAVSLSRGPHLIGAGLTVNRVHLSADEPDGFGAVYIFPDLPSLFSGRPDYFRQAFGNPRTQFPVASYGAFVQDHWAASRRLTLDLGVRYDFERLPAGLNQDTNNISPRVGLAYSPSASWVLRAGYGIFYDRFVLAELNRAIEKNGQSAFEQVADGDMATNIFRQAGGGPLKAAIPGLSPSIFRADPQLAAPYSQQASFGVDHLVSPNLTVSANYLFVRGVKLSRTRNTNLVSPMALAPQAAAGVTVNNPPPQSDGLIFGPGRVDPEWNDVYLLENSSSSTYHGLSTGLNRRLANEVEFSASYTWSKTLDDASDFGEQPANPFDLRSERALSLNHQEHRFVFSGLFELPFGEEEESGKASRVQRGVSRLLSRLLEHIELAPIITVGSGRPLDPLTGVDSNRSHPFPLSARPSGFARNSLRLPAFATIDLRMLKYFPMGNHRHLDLVVESFNLFNHTNVTGLNPFFGTGVRPIPGFALPVAASNARQIQFSIDFEF